MNPLCGECGRPKPPPQPTCECGCLRSGHRIDTKNLRSPCTRCACLDYREAK